MSSIEISVNQESLALTTEVMTLRDALDACRSSNKDLDATDSSSGASSVSHVRDNITDDEEREVLYQDGATPLFKAIEEANWREALRLVHESPNQVKAWVKSTGTQNTTFDWSLWRRLPLHEACRRQAPAWLVSRLLTVFPEAAKSTTQFGELPLHLAVGCGAAPEVVNLIVVANWEGIAARDKSGRTPVEIWDECELLVDDDHRVVFESLTRCHATYTNLQDNWYNKMDTLQKQHEAAIRALTDKHAAEMSREAIVKADLEDNLNKLHQSVEMLTTENTEQDEKIAGFARVERTWTERVDTLTKSVEVLHKEKSEEQENVEALHQLVEEKDEEIITLSTKVRKLTKDMQHINAWYDETDRGLAETQGNLQKMVDSYVQVHGKLSKERQQMRKLMVKRGIEVPSQIGAGMTQQPAPHVFDDYGSDIYEEEGSALMGEAANAAAAAASAALSDHLIADMD